MFLYTTWFISFHHNINIVKNEYNFFLKICLLISERERGRETSMWETPIGCHPHTNHEWGLNPQPTYVPWVLHSYKTKYIIRKFSGCSNSYITRLTYWISLSIIHIYTTTKKLLSIIISFRQKSSVHYLFHTSYSAGF